MNAATQQVKQVFCVGFLIDSDFSKVILIDKGHKKLKNFDMSLRWSGLGGGIKEGEHPKSAMHREFEEETGLTILGGAESWHCFLIKEYADVKIFCFCAFQNITTLEAIHKACKDFPAQEGQVAMHGLIDVLFDPDYYTHDTYYLLNMLVRESRKGFLPKFDPEGVNSSWKKS